MADTSTCDVTARAEILDIKQRLTEAEEAIVGKAEVTHAHSAADYIGATEDQLAAIDALAAALEENADVLDAYALKDHTHSGYATTSYVDTAIEQADIDVDLTGYATETYVQNQIEAIDIPEVDLTGYALKDHTHSQYLTEHQSLAGYATETYVQNQIEAIPEVDLSGYATTDYVDTAVANVEVDLTGYATKEYVTNEINEAALSGDGVEVDLSIYALKSEIPEVPSLEGYATETYVDDAVAAIEIPEVDLSNYATKEEIPTVPTNVSAFANDAGYLTAVPSEYVTETELNGKGYLTEHQSLDGYATEDYVTTAIENIDVGTSGTGCNIGAAGTGEGAEIFNAYSSNTASGSRSHAEGYITTASGDNSHAEGFSTIASGRNSHAEGMGTEATEDECHAEGYKTKATGNTSHAEGFGTEATNNYAHSEGYYTIAAGRYQHAQGKYNVEDTTSTYAHIVGNGSSDARSNCHTLDWDGNAWFAGNVYVGGTSMDDATLLGSGSGGSVDLSNYYTKTEVDDAITAALDAIGVAEEGTY